MTSVGDTVVVITGANGAVGSAVASAAHSDGAHLALIDLAFESSRELEPWESSDRTVQVVADVSLPEEVSKAFDTIRARWARIDVLVNAAGICPVTNLSAISDEEWKRVMDVNLTGAFRCITSAIGMMPTGSIVNVASIAGLTGGQAVSAHYVASKAGLIGLTKHLARALAPGIRVNAVAPGTLRTPMTAAWEDSAVTEIESRIPLGRLATASEVAAAILFLSSRSASAITGQVLNVDGGAVML